MTIKPPVEKTRSLLDEEAGIDLVFFRDEIKIFLISWFETRSRFVSSTSRASRRDREFVPSNLEFRDGDEILKKISCGRARYLVAKSHEIFRDRDISPCSVSLPWLSGQASGASSSTAGSPSPDSVSASESMMPLSSESTLLASSSLRNSVAVRSTTFEIEIYF